MESPEDATELLRQLRGGDESARAELLRLLYEDLHRRAAQYMRGQPEGHTLQATALVHEAYLKLTAGDSVGWDDRAHFLATASKAMRQILVDHARGRNRIKRSSQGARVPLDQIVLAYEDRAVDLAALDAALSRLAEFDPQMAEAVELRFFGGLDLTETATVLDMAKRTLERRWRTTRAWLHAELE